MLAQITEVVLIISMNVSVRVRNVKHDITLAQLYLKTTSKPRPL